MKFCKEFNDFTVDLPQYFKLRVSIKITDNKVSDFVCSEPSVGYPISLLKQVDDYGYEYILLEDLLKLALFKFPHLSLQFL